MNCNNASTPVDAGAFLDKCETEQKVDYTLYKQIIGSLRYICNTRPDIAYAVGLVSKHMEDPRQSHMTAAKRILKYLKETLGFGLMFPTEEKNSSKEMVGCSDADWCGDKVNKNSITGYLFSLGAALISWCSKK